MFDMCSAALIINSAEMEASSRIDAAGNVILSAGVIRGVLTCSSPTAILGVTNGISSDFRIDGTDGTVLTAAMSSSANALLTLSNVILQSGSAFDGPSTAVVLAGRVSLSGALSLAPSASISTFHFIARGVSVTSVRSPPDIGVCFCFG